GVVLTYQQQNQLASLDTNGAYTERTLPAMDGSRTFDVSSAANPPLVTSDVNGNMLLQRRYTRATYNSSTSQLETYRGVQFRLFNGNLSTIAAINTDDTSLGDLWANFDMAMGSGRT